jgi:hypothetical protein
VADTPARKSTIACKLAAVPVPSLASTVIPAGHEIEKGAVVSEPTPTTITSTIKAITHTNNSDHRKWHAVIEQT